MESHVRSLVKSATYRLGGLVLTTAIAWAMTGRVDVAASIGVADTLVKLGAFYVHERLWLRIGFGRIKAPDYEI